MTLAAIPNIQAYSRPNQQGMADGAVVTSVTDYSSNAIHGVTVNNPTYDATRGAIKYVAASSQYTKFDALSNLVFLGNNSPFTWLGNVQIVSVGILHQCIAIACLDAGFPWPTKDFYFRQETNSLHSDFRADDHTELTMDGCSINLGYNPLEWSFDGTYGYIRVNNVLVSKQPIAVGTLSIAGGEITEAAHRRGDASIDSYLNGCIGERGIWARYLTDAERASGVSYLQTLCNPQSPGFEPLSICVGGQHYRTDIMQAGNAASYNDGGTVAIWLAKGLTDGASPSNYDLNQFEGSAGPTISYLMQGGRPMAKMNGTYLWPNNLSAAANQYLSSGTPGFSVAGAFIAANIGVEQHLYTLSAANGAYFYIGIDTSGRFFVEQKNNATMVTRATASSSVGQSFHLWDMGFNGTSVTVTLDGTTIINAVPLSGGAMNISYCVPMGGSYIASGSVLQKPWYGWLGGNMNNPRNVWSASESLQILQWQQAYWNLPLIPSGCRFSKSINTGGSL